MVRVQPGSGGTVPETNTSETPSRPPSPANGDVFSRTDAGATVNLPTNDSAMATITANLPGNGTEVDGGMFGGLLSPTESAVLFGPIEPNIPLGLAAQVGQSGSPAFTAALIEMAIKDPSSLMNLLTPAGSNVYNVTLYAEVPAGSGQLKAVQVPVTDTILGPVKTDAQGNPILWSSLMDKAYAKLGAMTLEGQPLHLTDPLSTLTGREVTMLDATADTHTLWETLSLANAPLEVPVTAYTGGQVEGTGLAPDQSYSVLGTFMGPEGEQMVAVHAAAAEADSEVLNVPLQAFQKAVSQTVAADGRPQMHLEGREGAQQTHGLGGCCMSGTPTSMAAVHDRPSMPVHRLSENRCLLCPFARGLCMPGGSSQP
jgi:hypothetical protein